MDYVYLVKDQWPLSEPWFYAFCIAMFIDFLMGVMCAIKSRSLNSSVARDGMFRKMGMALIVALGIVIGPFVPVIQIALNGGTFKMTIAAIACSGFLFSECISILENGGRLGIQTDFLKTYLEKLRPSGEDEEPKTEENKQS